MISPEEYGLIRDAFRVLEDELCQRIYYASRYNDSHDVERQIHEACRKVSMVCLDRLEHLSGRRDFPPLTQQLPVPDNDSKALAKLLDSFT